MDKITCELYDIILSQIDQGNLDGETSDELSAEDLKLSGSVHIPVPQSSPSPSSDANQTCSEPSAALPTHVPASYFKQKELGTILIKRRKFIGRADQSTSLTLSRYSLLF